MAKYGGGHEDFDKEAKALDALADARKALIAKEAAFQQKLAEGNRLQSEGARTSRTRAAAKKEAAEVDERSARSAGRSAKAIEVDTAAIEANTRARERANRVQAMSKGAVGGAQSPQYAEAYRLSQEQGAIPSQYRLRQMSGVGQRRAAAMVQAMQAGLRPATGDVDINRPLSRVAAAHEAVAASEYRLAQANEEYTRVRRRGTEGEAQAAYAAREAAKAGRESAHTELNAAQRVQADQIERNNRAIAEETESRKRVAQKALEYSRTNLTPGQLALPAAGQTAQGMPLYPAQTRTAVPLNIPMRGPEGPNWTPGDPSAAKKLGAESAAAEARDMRQLAEATARQAEKTGQLREAADLYNTTLNDPARGAALEYSAKAQDLEAKHAAAMGRTAAANREAAVSFYPLSQAMHRHGALTSEFITAAARGEVTLREMGNQALITAGKFGGWTVAASGVYAVAGALGQVAEGAIKASSGTDQAYRVITQNRDPDALQKSFGDLSSKFNVPIDTAADAVYRMGQVFHDQNDAVKAAEASLYSFKTGEVDVATSTKNLIAIQRAFGLSSDNLVGIFDQINQAQNTFGIGIGDTEAGLAKAAGTWKQAGGDLDYLLSLFVAIQKATGRGGEEIGTALSRLYYVQHPEAAQKLKGLGVDVDLRDAQKTFSSVMQQAKAPGADIQGLASGLLGNQYARMLTAVLADQETFEKAQADTSAAASQGSAQNELAKVLSQVDEQLTSLGNHFQRLGEAMARAGGFDLAGLLLKSLNGALGAAEALVNIFNLLPSPLRESVTVLAELAVGLALVRRLGATERLANTPLGFLADPVGRAKTHTVAGLRQAQTEAFNRLERAGSINVDKGHEQDLRRKLVEEMRPEFESVKHLDTEDPKRKEVETRWVEANRAAALAEHDLAISTKRLDAARDIALTSERDLQLAQNTSRRKFEATAKEKGWPSPKELDQPNTAGIAIAGAGGGVTPTGRTGATAGAQARRLASSTQWVEMKSVEMAAGLRVWGESAKSASATFGPLATVVDKAGVAVGRATGFVQRAGGSLRGMGGSLRGLMSAFGPLDMALVGLIGVGVFQDQVRKLEEATDRTRDTLTGVTSTQAAVANSAAVANKIISQDRPADLTGPSKSTLQAILDAPESLRSWWNDITGLTKAANATRQEIDERERLQKQQAAAGKARPQLTYGQLSEDAEKDAQERKAGLISQKEYDRRAALHLIEQKTLLDANAAQQDQARQALADANRAVGSLSYDKSLLAMKPDEFSKEMQGTGAAVELYGLTDHNMDYLKRQYAAAEQKYRNSNKPDDLQALNAARSAYFQAIIGEVQKELQFELLGASNEGARRQIYARAAQQYQQMRITVKQQNQQRRDTKKKADDAKKELDKQQDFEDQGGHRHMRTTNEDPGDPQSGNYEPTDKQVRERENQQRKSREKLSKDLRKKQKQVDADIDRQNRDLDLAALQLKQAAYEDRQQGREILLNLQLAGTADPMRQAALNVDNARRQVADAAREWGSQSRQYRQALTGLRNAQTQQAQAILAGVQADNAILLARAGDDPVQQARVAAENAQRELTTMQKDPKHFDPNQVKQQRANVIDAERAARDARQQQQQDLIRLQGELDAARAGGDPVATARAAIKAAQLAKKNAKTDVEKLQALVDLANANNALQDALVEREQARFNLLKSQTDDPVEKAKIDLDAAKNALKGAKGTDKINKTADYNNAKKAYEDAKISDREDTINFEFQMDKITADEAAKQLEALANIKGISKAKKRELLLQAKQLRDQASGDYELDVGSIRLPSLYEVRRFVQGGQPNASQVVTDNRNFVVNIATADAAHAFGSELELTNGTSAKAAARSMQMR